MRETSELPLTGVKVIDFGQYIAGPAVGMMLGDLGATVVHIDPPSGPKWDSPANAVLNRNKLMLKLDHRYRRLSPWKNGRNGVRFGKAA